jgi:hypothetical protein
MYSARGDTALPVPGFPIRESAGQSLFSSSPRLIAAVHALLRLLVPRHPPCALTILTVIVDNYDARRRRGYNGDLFNAAAQAKLALRRFRCTQRASRPLRWPCCAVFKVRRGRNRGFSPAGLSKLSSTRPPARGRQAPDSVDVLDAPREPRGPAAGSAVRQAAGVPAAQPWR